MRRGRINVNSRQRKQRERRNQKIREKENREIDKRKKKRKGNEIREDNFSEDQNVLRSEY